MNELKKAIINAVIRCEDMKLIRTIYVFISNIMK